MPRDRSRALLVVLVFVALLFDFALTLTGIGRFGEGNPVIAWFYLHVGHLGVVLYFACVGSLYSLLVATCPYRVGLVVAFVAWASHVLGGATWLPGTFSASVGGWAYAPLVTVLLVSGFLVARALELSRLPQPLTTRDESLPSGSGEATRGRQQTADSAHGLSFVPAEQAVLLRSNAPAVHEVSMSHASRTSLLLVLSTSYGVDLVVTALYLIDHSSGRPVLDWFDFQFGIAGTLLYFACIGSVYWHAVRMLPHRLVVIVTVSAWFMHLYDISSRVFAPTSPVGPVEAFLFLVALALAASLFLVRVHMRPNRTAT